MLIKIVAFIFIIFIGSKILRKFKEKSLGFSALVIWLLVLCAVLVTAFEQHISDSVAHLMGGVARPHDEAGAIDHVEVIALHSQCERPARDGRGIFSVHPWAVLRHLPALFQDRSGR